MFNFEEFKFNVECFVDGIRRSVANYFSQGDYFQLETNFEVLSEEYVELRIESRQYKVDAALEVFGKNHTIETLYSRIDSLLNVIDEMGEVLDETLAERDYARDTLKDIGREVDFLLCDAGVYDEVEYIYDEKERDEDGVILGSKEHLLAAYNRVILGSKEHLLAAYNRYKEVLSQ